MHDEEICYMKQSRILLIFLLLFALAAVFLLPASAASEAETAAQELYALGLFKGVGTAPDGTPDFALDKAPTRNEAVTAIVRLLGKEAEAQHTDGETPFEDLVPWAKPYVGYAQRSGLVQGVSETHFGGDTPVSAAQYLTMLLRALGYRSGEDFDWQTPWTLSDRIGFTGGQYPAEASFTRGDLAILSRRALSAHLKGSATTLLQVIQHNRASEDSKLLRDGSYFEVHFLNVGQADAALVVCDGQAMLIDGGNVADSRLIYSYLKSHTVDRLAYVVCTHPHEDHVGGLAGALNYAKAEHALCSVTAFDSKPFRDFIQYLEKQGVTLTVPNCGDSFPLGSATVQVLGPVRPLESVNDASLVLRIVYGETSFLFTGDAGREEEADILAAGCSLASTVLKVGHHGSASSTTYPFLREVMPKYAVISVGENKYGHPTEDTLSRLRDADATVFRTDMQGNIICRSDGKTVTVSVSRNPDADTLGGLPRKDRGKTDPEPAAPTAGEPQQYVLNKNTGVFHLPSCDSVTEMKEKNKGFFEGTRDEAIAKGYHPCGRCKP